MTRSSPPPDAHSDSSPLLNADDSDSRPSDAPRTARGNRDLSSILRETMANTPVAVNVLPGVQQKLRERSGGKFYRDRWSTDRSPPIPTYLVTSALMLAIVIVAYLILRPIAGVASPAPAPAPVQIVPAPAQNR